MPSFQYMGGYPYMPKQTSGTLTIKNNNLIFEFTVFLKSKFLVIPFENIIDMRAMTEEQLSREASLSAIALFGVYGFAMHNTKSLHQTYLTIHCVINDIESVVVFSGRAAHKICAAFYTQLDELKQMEQNPEYYYDQSRKQARRKRPLGFRSGRWWKGCIAMIYYVAMCFIFWSFVIYTVSTDYGFWPFAAVTGLALILPMIIPSIKG